MATEDFPVIDLTGISITTDTECIDLTETECKEPEHTCPICMDTPDASCAFCPGCLITMCKSCLASLLSSPCGHECPVCKHKWVTNDMKVYAGLITEEEATEATPEPETIHSAASSTRPRRRLIGNLPDAPFYIVGDRIYARDEVINTNPAVRSRRRRTRRVQRRMNAFDDQLMEQRLLINNLIEASRQ
mgnify:CR=1 FL=1